MQFLQEGAGAPRPSVAWHGDASPKIAFAILWSPRLTLSANFQQNKKSAPHSGELTEFLLSLKFYKVTDEIDHNTHGNSKNNYLYNKMYRDVIIYAVT